MQATAEAREGWIRTDDATLHVEVDGAGEPVSLLAHGLTNSCQELAAVTPLLPGTKIRFDFRGHGHSSSPESGYGFADLARDVRAVADAYDAEVAAGTSLGAGALCRLIEDLPDRFRKLIFLLPAGVDRDFRVQAGASSRRARLLRTADLIESKTRDEAIATLLAEREVIYETAPWLREVDRKVLRNINPIGVARAIREVVEDAPLRDRNNLRRVSAPALVICRRGDVVHPLEAGQILAELIPNAELLVFRDGRDMYERLPEIIARVHAFLVS